MPLLKTYTLVSKSMMKTISGRRIARLVFVKCGPFRGVKVTVGEVGLISWRPKYIFGLHGLVYESEIRLHVALND